MEFKKIQKAGGRAGSRSDNGGRGCRSEARQHKAKPSTFTGGKKGGKGRRRGVRLQQRVGVRSATQNPQLRDFHMQIPRRAPRSQMIFKEPNKHWMGSKARERRSKRGRIGERRTAGRREGGAKSRRREEKVGRRRRSGTPPFPGTAPSPQPGYSPAKRGWSDNPPGSPRSPPSSLRQS